MCLVLPHSKTLWYVQPPTSDPDRWNKGHTHVFFLYMLIKQEWIEVLLKHNNTRNVIKGFSQWECGGFLIQIVPPLQHRPPKHYDNTPKQALGGPGAVRATRSQSCQITAGVTFALYTDVDSQSADLLGISLPRCISVFVEVSVFVGMCLSICGWLAKALSCKSQFGLAR